MRFNMASSLLTAGLLLMTATPGFGAAASARPAQDAPVVDAPQGDVIAHDNRSAPRLAAMFNWWNVQMAQGHPFEVAGFRHYYTEDAVLIIDGAPAARGIDALTAHFRAIQESGAQVEIVVPFLSAFSAGDREYAYHVIKSRRNGVPRCMLAAGHAVIADGLIQEISLVRTVVDANTPSVSHICDAD